MKTKMEGVNLPIVFLHAHILSQASSAARPDCPRSDRPIFAIRAEK